MSDKARILVVDDDDLMRGTISAVLKNDGFDTEEARDASGIVTTLKTREVDLVVLDLMLGADDGLVIAREIRANSRVPIIMLTGKTDVIDRVVGLEIGADDYITKPFHNREFLARVKSVLRRSSERADSASTHALAPATEIAHFGEWVLDLSSGHLTGRDGEPVTLTTYEYQVLTVFVRHPKRALTRSQILDLVADRDWEPFDRSIDVLIGKLRRKLNDDARAPRYVRTMRNIGYMFISDVSFSR